MRDQRREATKDCRGHKQRSLSGQLISRVFPQKKQVSRNPLKPDSIEDRRKEKTVLSRSAREIEIKEKTKKRTEWRGQR